MLPCRDHRKKMLISIFHRSFKFDACNVSPCNLFSSMTTAAFEFVPTLLQTLSASVSQGSFPEQRHSLHLKIWGFLLSSLSFYIPPKVDVSRCHKAGKHKKQDLPTLESHWQFNLSQIVQHPLDLKLLKCYFWKLYFHLCKTLSCQAILLLSKLGNYKGSTILERKRQKFGSILALDFSIKTNDVCISTSRFSCWLIRSPQGPVASFHGGLVSCALSSQRLEPSWGQGSSPGLATLLTRQTSPVATLVYGSSWKYFSHFTDFMSFSPPPLFHSYQFGSFPHFMTSNPTLSLKSSLIIQPRAFFFPRTLKTVRFIQTSPLAASFSNYFHGYLINSKELYKGQLQSRLCILIFSF